MNSGQPAFWRYRSELPFFLLFGLYIRFCLDPQILYDALGVVIPYPTFRASWTFFTQEALSPGGTIEYVSAFLSHGFHYSWVGSVIITMIAVVIWICTATLINAACRVHAPWLALVPVIALLAAFSSFEHPLARYDSYLGPFTASMTLALALVCSAVYTRSRRRPVLFFVLSVITCLLGGGAALVFAALVGTVEALNRRWIASAASWLIGLAIPYALSVFVFDIIPADGCTRLLPMSYWTNPWAYGFASGMYLSVPAVTLFSAARVRWSRQYRIPARGLIQAHPLLARVACTLTPILVALMVVSMTYDHFRGSFLKMAHFSRHQMWVEAVDTARNLPTAGFEHPYFHRETLRALYHSGRLGYDLFSFAHTAAAAAVPFLSLPSQRQAQLWDHAQIARLALELGDLNRAEHFSHELLEGAGENPRVVEQLALINLVKGQIQTARVFLNAQAEYLIYDDHARRMLQLLDEDPELKSDEHVQYLRSAMFIEDDVRFIEHGPDRVESVRTLIDLLERNPANKMAFEYLMTRYLLNGQVAQVIENMGRLSALGYREIPLLYEEAIAVHEFTTETRVELDGDLRVSQATRRRFEEFKSISRRFRSNLPGARKELAPSFGQSFFYYRTFGKTGV